MIEDRQTLLARAARNGMFRTCDRIDAAKAAHDAVMLADHRTAMCDYRVAMCDYRVALALAHGFRCDRNGFVVAGGAASGAL